MGAGCQQRLHQWPRAEGHLRTRTRQRCCLRFGTRLPLEQLKSSNIATGGTSIRSVQHIECGDSGDERCGAQPQGGALHPGLGAKSLQRAKCQHFRGKAHSSLQVASERPPVRRCPCEAVHAQISEKTSESYPWRQVDAVRLQRPFLCCTHIDLLSPTFGARSMLYSRAAPRSASCRCRTLTCE